MTNVVRICIAAPRASAWLMAAIGAVRMIRIVRTTRFAMPMASASSQTRAGVIARRVRSVDRMEIVCPAKPAVSAWTTRVGRTLMDSIARITQKNHRDAIGH